MERKAELIWKERVKLGDDAFVDARVWAVPEPVRGSAHGYKYALVYVVAGECVLRYDNESGKGDHIHLCGQEKGYAFSTPGKLIDDFWADVAKL